MKPIIIALILFILIGIGCKKNHDYIEVPDTKWHVINKSTTPWFPENFEAFGANTNGQWGMLYIDQQENSEFTYGTINDTMLTLIKEIGQFHAADNNLTGEMIIVNSGRGFAATNLNLIIELVSNSFVASYHPTIIDTTSNPIYKTHNLIFDSQNYLWSLCGPTNKSSLVKINFGGQSNYPFIPPTTILPNYNFGAFVIDKNNQIWLADILNRQVVKYIPANEEWQVVSNPQSSFLFDFILNPAYTSMAIDNQNQIWMLFDKNIVIYSLTENKFIFNKPNSWYNGKNYNYKRLHWDAIDNRMWLLGDPNVVAYVENDKFTPISLKDSVKNSAYIDGTINFMTALANGSKVFWSNNQVIIYKK